MEIAREAKNKSFQEEIDSLPIGFRLWQDGAGNYVWNSYDSFDFPITPSGKAIHLHYTGEIPDEAWLRIPTYDSPPNSMHDEQPRRMSLSKRVPMNATDNQLADTLREILRIYREDYGIPSWR